MEFLKNLFSTQNGVFLAATIVIAAIILGFVLMPRQAIEESVTEEVDGKTVEFLLLRAQTEEVLNLSIEKNKDKWKVHRKYKVAGINSYYAELVPVSP